MISAADAQALHEGRHGDPFAHLGVHQDASGRWWLRALLPNAQTVEVLQANTPQALATLARCGNTDVFEGVLPQVTARPAYCLRVRWNGTNETECLPDPYAFGSDLSPHDLLELQAGTHPRPYTVLGAHPQERAGVAGVRFAVWAPNAQRVSVVGDFNGWDGRRHPMRRHPAQGVWEIFLPRAAVGDRYKYELLDSQGRLLPLKADPYAFASELRPNTASVVWRLPAERPACPERARRNQQDQPISVYELHLGSWRRHPDGRFYDWDELADCLPAYVSDLGFTHLQVMPVTEHPFDGSWGYQTLGMFAPTARFGDPDGLLRLIDACHEAKLNVLLDWVPAHFPTDAHGLSRFDGTALYEYADPREGFHRDWNTAIYNFGRHEVRNFLAGSALYWIERYGFDGLRVDAVSSMLYRDYSRGPGEWVPNVHGGRENLEAISLLQSINTLLGARHPEAITVAEESTSFAGVSRPVHAGGLGFHYKWNMGWMHDSLSYMQQEPVHRRWHHHRMTFGLVYAFDENFVLPLSHDEVVHGKGSLHQKMPGDEWQSWANLRAYYAFMWGHPGKKLLFMGSEWGQHAEWNHDQELDWPAAAHAPNAGLRCLITDLNRLYQGHPALHTRDTQPSGFEWIDHENAQASVLAWVRHGQHGQPVLVVCNFTPVVRHHTRLGVPSLHGVAAWRECLNTDAAAYGGSGVGNAGASVPVHAEPSHGRESSIVLTLPPLATLYLEPA